MSAHFSMTMFLLLLPFLTYFTFLFYRYEYNSAIAYIQNNFCLPEDISAYKWGHVLKVYLAEKKKSLTAAKCLHKVFSDVPQNSLFPEVVKIERHYKKIISMIHKPSYSAKLKDICARPFEATCTPSTSTYTPSISAHTPKPSVSTTTSSTVSTSIACVTPSRITTRNQCKFCSTLAFNYSVVYGKLRESRRQHNQLRDKYRRKGVKRLNATLKRLHESVTPVRSELKNVKRRFQRLDVKHQDLVGDFKALQTQANIWSKQHEVEIDVLQEQLEELGKREKTPTPAKEGKAYSAQIRLLTYMLNCNTPTLRIPRLLTTFYKTLKIDIQAVPTNTTVERMALELGVLSDHINSEVLYVTENCTLAFDASTQGGVHFNVLYLSTPTHTYTLAVDELPGGTAEDYSEHILTTVKHIALIYSRWHPKVTAQYAEGVMIQNISAVPVLSDRAIVNQCAVNKVSPLWKKDIHQLYCNIHSLETITREVKKCLKDNEEGNLGKLFSSKYVCLMERVIMAMNKMRFNDKVDNPKGFVNFLVLRKLGKGLLKRARVNRIHLYFHLAELYVVHYELCRECSRRN